MRRPRKLSLDGHGKVVIPLRVRQPAEAVRLTREAAVQLACDLLATFMCDDCGQVHEVLELAISFGAPPLPEGLAN